MSKDKPGYMNPKDAEKCKVLGPEGKPCPLFTASISQCQVRAMIDQGRHDRSAYESAKQMYSQQIPDNGCPGKYKE